MMKKSSILFLLFGFIFLFCGCISQEKLSPNVETMIKFSKEGKADKSIQFFKNFTDKEYNEFEKYLDLHPGDLPPIYFIYMADKVFEHNKEKAIFYFSFGKLRAMEDVLMCKDKSAQGQLGIYPLLAEKTTIYHSTLNDIKLDIDIMQKTLDWDDRYTERVSPIWACYHGGQIFVDNNPPELLPPEDFNKQRELVRIIIKKSIEARKNNPNFYKDIDNTINQKSRG